MPRESLCRGPTAASPCATVSAARGTARTYSGALAGGVGGLLPQDRGVRSRGTGYARPTPSRVRESASSGHPPFGGRVQPHFVPGIRRAARRTLIWGHRPRRPRSAPSPRGSRRRAGELKLPNFALQSTYSIHRPGTSRACVRTWRRAWCEQMLSATELWSLGRLANFTAAAG